MTLWELRILVLSILHKRNQAGLVGEQVIPCLRARKFKMALAWLVVAGSKAALKSKGWLTLAK